MTLLSYKTCSYAGVDFLFKNLSTEGGNRLIKYLYPGSDKQSIEVQGTYTRVYKVVAVIPNDGYFAKRADLLRVLEAQTPAVLSHPTFGRLSDVVAGRYVLKEPFDRSGVAYIEIDFEVDNAKGVPQAVQFTASRVNSQSGTVRAQIQTDFGDRYSVQGVSPKTYEDAQDQTADFVSAIRAGASLLSQANDTYGEFNAAVNRFEADKLSLLQDAPLLAERSMALIEGLDGLYDDQPQKTAAMQGLFSFGQTDTTIQPDTADKLRRANNRSLLRGLVQGGSLAYAYTSGVRTTYNTLSQQKTNRENLETQYNQVKSNAQAGIALYNNLAALQR